MVYTLLDRQIIKHRDPKLKTIDAAISYAIEQGAFLTRQYVERLHIKLLPTHPTLRVFEAGLNHFLTPAAMDLFSLMDVVDSAFKEGLFYTFPELKQRNLRHTLSTHESWITSDDLINAFVKDCIYGNFEGKNAASLIFTYTDENIKNFVLKKSLATNEKKCISMSTDISGTSAAAALIKELPQSMIFYTIPKNQNGLRQSIAMHQQSDKTTLVSHENSMPIKPYAYYERDKTLLNILDAEQFVEQSIYAIIYHEVFLSALQIFQLLAFLDSIGMEIKDASGKIYSLHSLSQLSLFQNLAILKNMILPIIIDPQAAIRLQKSFVELENIQNTAHEALTIALKNHELQKFMMTKEIWDVVYRLLEN